MNILKEYISNNRDIINEYINDDNGRKSSLLKFITIIFQYDFDLLYKLIDNELYTNNEAIKLIILEKNITNIITHHKNFYDNSIKLLEDFEIVNEIYFIEKSVEDYYMVEYYKYSDLDENEIQLKIRKININRIL